jgi:hypothetical protein
MAVENRLWGQRRVQAELARLGFPVSARTVAKYMRRPYDGVPSPTWRTLLTDWWEVRYPDGGGARWSRRMRFTFAWGPSPSSS